MLTIIKGSLTDEVRSFLIEKGLEILPYTPTTIPNNLPKVKRPYVSLQDGRYGSQQLREAFNIHDFLLNRNQAQMVLAVRRFKEETRDEIHMVLGSGQSYEYAALTIQDFRKALDNLKGGTAIQTCESLMLNMLVGKQSYLDFVPRGLWTNEQLALRLGWDWRYQY